MLTTYPRPSTKASEHAAPIPFPCCPLPDCLTDHAAPPSVAAMFAQWVELADASDSGRIEIRLDRQPYSRRTTALALRWLAAHHLIMRTRSGRGRGCGSVYFVRWSFTDPTLRARQDRRNHLKRILSESAKGTESAYTRAKEGLEERQKINSTPQETAGSGKSLSSEGAAAPSTPATTPDRLAWLARTNLDRLPSHNERRAIAAAIRELAADRRLIDPLLDALFWRTRSLPLHVWSAAWACLSDPRFKPQRPPRRGEIDLRSETDWTRSGSRDLQWRTRQAVAALSRDPSDVDAFRKIIADGPPRTATPVADRLAGVERSLADEIDDRSLADESLTKRPGVCPICGRPIAGAERLTIHGIRYQHPCLRAQDDRIARLQKLRNRLRIELGGVG